jgi:sugar-specific transcriptional regulator TrmB
MYQHCYIFMNTHTLLNKLGFNEREAAVYLTLLEGGPATVADIGRKAGLYRTYVYKALPELMNRGLVTKGPFGKRTVYSAEPPDRLEFTFELLRTELAEALPELRSMYSANSARPVVKYLEGKKGISSVFDDLVTTLSRGDMFYRYSSAKDLTKTNRYLPNNYRERRDNKQLERLVITSEVQAGEKRPRLERDIKVVPRKYDPFDDDITQIVYGNKVAFIDYNSDTAVTIENQKFADFQKKIFLLLYRSL